jgi:hypothetical protein
MSIPVIMLKPESTRAAYDKLVEVLRGVGPCRIEERKESVAFFVGREAFLFVQPKQGGIRIKVPLDRRLQGSRVTRSEQVSKERFENEVDVSIPQQFDEELLGWIREAYELKKAPPAA